MMLSSASTTTANSVPAVAFTSNEEPISSSVNPLRGKLRASSSPEPRTESLPSVSQATMSVAISRSDSRTTARIDDGMTSPG